MRILILEDADYRIEWFREFFKDEEVLDITEDPKEACRLLERREYDYIFLDHDLLPSHYDNDTVCDETTGLCVAKYLGEKPWLSKEAEIFLHTQNEPGSYRMKGALQDGKRESRWIPYPVLKVSMTKD